MSPRHATNVAHSVLSASHGYDSAPRAPEVHGRCSAAFPLLQLQGSETTVEPLVQVLKHPLGAGSIFPARRSAP